MEKSYITAIITKIDEKTTECHHLAIDTIEKMDMELHRVINKMNGEGYFVSAIAENKIYMTKEAQLGEGIYSNAVGSLKGCPCNDCNVGSGGVSQSPNGERKYYSCMNTCTRYWNWTKLHQ